MTRKQVKELLPFLQAFANGEPIQALCNNEWRNMGNDPDIDPNFCKYRIKPRLKYRPFNNVKECWKEMQKHQPIGWVKCGDLLFNIITIKVDGIIAHNSTNNIWYTFESAIKLNFADGTPFGIKELKEE